MSGVDIGLAELAALLGKAIGRELPRRDELAVARSDSARRELRQPVAVLEQIRQFHSEIGLPATLRCLQEAQIAVEERTACERTHNLEHLNGVLLVGDKQPKRAPGLERSNGVLANILWIFCGSQRVNETFHRGVP